MSSQLTGLSQVFGNVSNSQHLFQSPTHADALRLLSGVPEEGRNIRLLIGEPGVGKTMLLLRLLKQFQHSALTAHLLWTQLGRNEFLRYFLHELGVPDPATEIAQAQKQLTRALEGEFCQGRKVIVAIDEAQNLEIPALRGLAELLDCNLARSKDMQVVLAGFPQLQSKLASPELQGIRDRISAIVSLSPLTPDETVSYIDRGLEVSGYHGDGPFTSNALAVIATLAEGIPRNINNICSAALYVAEKRARSVIDSSMVFEAAAQQQGRLITQETMQPWTASPTEFPTEHVASDQQMCGSAQQPISTPDLVGGIPVTEGAGNTVAHGWVDDQTRAVPDRICRWFGNQRVAWSGTVGALATAVDQPEPEVVHALHANSDILRNFGIAVSVYERAGRTRSVSLRRLEEQKQTTAEEANPGLRLSEWEVDTRQDFDANDSPEEKVPSRSEPQPRDRLAESVLTEDAPEAASISPADQARRCTISDVKDRLENARSLPKPASKIFVRTVSAKLRVTVVIATLLVLFAATVALQLRSRQTRPSLATDNGLTAKGAVAKRVLPDVPQTSRMTVRGTVPVSIRVTADSSGNVSNAIIDSPGVRRYLANLALQAARGWKFEPPQVDGQAVTSVWILRFQFRKTGTDVIPVEANAFSSREQESPHVVTGLPASASAQTLSGIRVLEENGGPPNRGEATTSFQQAALSGDPNAQFELGTAYALGRGIPADPVAGYTWLTLAFANGDRQAETLIRELTPKLSQSEIARVRSNLGEMYANGVGVHPDKVTAYMWHLLAESAGETRGNIARSQLASTMTDDERSEAKARASEWLRKHHN